MLFLALALVLFFGLGLGDRASLPSALIDKPFPSFALPRLEDGIHVTQKDLQGKPRLVNIWATWCVNCLREHEILMLLSEEYGVEIVGINYRDDMDMARSWLESYSNPYVFNIVDESGTLGIDLGVYGAPETFLVDAHGIVRFRQVGEITMEVWEREISPVFKSLKHG